MTSGNPDIDSAHAYVTTLLSRRYPMVDREDIAQEAWLAYYGSGIALDGSQMATEGPEGPSVSPEYQKAIGRLKREMRNAGERMCRREKAAQEGYQPRDEAFYSTTALGKLLEAWFATGPAEAPPRTRETSVSRPANEHERGNYLVSLIDVGTAIKELNGRDKEILFYAYSTEYAGRTDEEIASELRSSGWKNLTEDAFKGKVRRALTRLQRRLGGPDPYQ